MTRGLSEGKIRQQGSEGGVGRGRERGEEIVYWLKEW